MTTQNNDTAPLSCAEFQERLPDLFAATPDGSTDDPALLVGALAGHPRVLLTLRFRNIQPPFQQALECGRNTNVVRIQG